jgi:hypothetical protein
MHYVEGASAAAGQAQAPAGLTNAGSEEAVVTLGKETTPGLETTILTAPQEQSPLPASETETAKPDLPASNLPPWLLSQFPEATPSAPPAEPAEPTPVEAEPPGSEKLPEWLDSHAESTAPAPTVEENTEQIEKPNDEEIPDWLRSLQLQPPTVEEGAAADTPKVASDNLPVWLESTSEQPPAGPLAKDETEAVKSSDEEHSPDWLRNLPTATATDEAAAAEPQTTAASIEEPVTSLLPVTPPDTKPEQAAESPVTPSVIPSAPPKAAEMPPTPPPAPSAPAFVPAPQPTEPAPRRRRQPKGYAHLMLAREHRGAHQINDALTEYDYIVQHAPRLVKDVIDDLEMLTAQPDAPLDAHRILGDAYSRADRLAEALECYQFVLERTSREQSA